MQQPPQNTTPSTLTSSEMYGYTQTAGAGTAYTTITSTTSQTVADRILSATTVPVDIAETETATVFGQTGILANKEDIIGWSGTIPLSEYPINEDPNPEVIRKPTTQKVVYTQEFAIRYLQPPLPPPLGDIIIREEMATLPPPAPPLVIRQLPPRPETPTPQVLREMPPRPPVDIMQKVITVSGKKLPPPPRRVIMERLAPLPAPPQSLIVERWLSYPQRKRNVVFQRAAELQMPSKPKNTIVQWEAPAVEIRQEFRDLGIIQASPAEYVQRYGSTLKETQELPANIRSLRPPTGFVLASEMVQEPIILEGDVYALSLVDLDKEGLSEYRPIAEKHRGFAIKYLYGTHSRYQEVLPEILSMIQRDANGRVSINEARRVLTTFNKKLGKRLCDAQMDAYLHLLDRHTGFINYDEFTSSLRGSDTATL